jgi:signal peptidase II
MYFYLISFLSAIFDYISKNISNNYLSENKIYLLWDYLKLELSKNKWIAFSLPIEWLLLKIITIIIIILITFYYLNFEKEKNKLFIQIWYWLIIWWAVWNAIERIFVWSVTDFISVKYFAIFNFADIFINIWVIILIFSILYYGKQWNK